MYSIVEHAALVAVFTGAGPLVWFFIVRKRVPSEVAQCAIVVLALVITVGGTLVFFTRWNGTFHYSYTTIGAIMSGIEIFAALILMMPRRHKAKQSAGQRR